MSLKAPATLCSEIMPNGLHDAELWGFEDFYFFISVTKTDQTSTTVDGRKFANGFTFDLSKDTVRYQ